MAEFHWGSGQLYDSESQWRHMPATLLQLLVKDTGSGIAVVHPGQIFEPLYTTKPSGTGLGLYIVQEIVAVHGGQITVGSEEGQDSVFTIALPRCNSF